MSLNKKIVDITRELRRKQTPQEKEFWGKLRNRKLIGLKFLRQHPIVYGYRGYTPLFFVADFYCDHHKLVIEVDGKVHNFQKDYDANRDSILNDLGLTVLRINNGGLKNIEGVLNKIVETVNPTHPPDPSLQSGEGVIERSEVGGELAIILLAAGPSSRMGQPKQQLLIDEKTLLARAVEIALKSGIGKIIVMLGSQEETHRQLLKEMPVDTIFNAQWQKGMGSSLKTGLQNVISNNPKTEAIIVMVCDQPLLQVEHIQALIRKYKETNSLIIASAYASTMGVPVLFNQKLFTEIFELQDDQGAKKIIQQHHDQVETIDFPEGAVDLDTPEDYYNFVQSKKMP